MIKEEWRRIYKNKLFLITFVGMLCIPILYAGFFVKSVWDPYGNTADLPVAVVNLDQSVAFGDETLHVGDDLIDKLKDNHDMKWSFVSSAEAQTGLEDQTYYMIVTIPEDFSEHAATVLDSQPQAMNINYTTNGSLNYIAEVMGNAAVKALKAQVAEQVTTAYVEAVTDKLNDVKIGFGQAADGATQIHEGAEKLNDGTDVLQDGLNQLANSTITFTNGTTTFEYGLNQYIDGIYQVDQGAGQLNDGVTQIVKKMPELESGLNQLGQGSESLESGVVQYTEGVNGVHEATKTLTQKEQLLTSGITQGFSGLQKNVDLLAKGNQQLANGGHQLANQLPDDQSIESLSEQLTALNTAIQSLPATTDTTMNIEANIESLLNKLDAINVNQNDTAMQIEHVMNAEVVQKLSAEEQQELQQVLVANMQTDTVDNTQAIADLKAEIQTLQQTVYGNVTPKNDVANIQALSNQVLPQASASIGSMIPAHQQINALVTAMDELANNSQALSTGVGSISGEMNDNLAAYDQGMQQLQKGTTQLANKSDSLVMGTKGLNIGLKTFKEKMPHLSDGVNQLAFGSNKLQQGTDTLRQKSTPLMDGAVTIDDGARQLHQGATKLADGGSQLQTGMQTLNTGSKELSTKLGDAQKQTADIEISDANIKQMAMPLDTTQIKYSNVPNYGHALAPYVMSLALFMGCIVFNYIYPIRRKAKQDGTTFEWFISKISIGAVAALAMGLIEATVMLLLGLQVVNIFEYYCTILLAAESFMFLVMFLSILLDNIGRFVAVILLVLQLAGSGGTFPMPVTSGFFNAIHPFLPMTYSIMGLREAMTSGLGTNVFVFNGFILLMLAIVSIVLIFLSMVFLNKKRVQMDNGKEDNQFVQGILNL